jgi:hypothetical protein
MGLLYLYL